MALLFLFIIFSSEIWQNITNRDRVLDIGERGDTIYLATAGGLSLLSKKDFTELRRYLKVDGLKNVSLIALATNEKGLLFVAQKGSGIAYREDDIFYPYAPTEGIEEKLMTTTDLLFVGDTLFVGTERGLFLIDTKGTTNPSDDVLSYFYEENSPLLSRTILSLSYFKRRLYIGTSRGVSIINLEDFSWDSLRKEDGLPGDSVFSLYVDEDIIGAGTESGLVVFYKTSSRRDTFLTSSKVFSIARRNDTLFIAPSATKGISTSGGVFFVILSESGREYGWIDRGMWYSEEEWKRTPLTLFVTSEGKLLAGFDWIKVYGSRDDDYGGGLAYLEDGKWIVKRDNALPFNLITSLVESEDGTVWIGCWLHVPKFPFTVVGRRGDEWIYPDSFIIKDPIYLEVGKDGLLYVSDFLHGIYIIDSGGKIVDSIKLTFHPLANAIRALSFDLEGNLLVAVYPKNSIYRIFEDKSYEPVFEEEYFSSPIEVEVDKKGRIWIGSSEAGVYVVEGENVYNYQQPEIPSNSVNRIVSSGDIVWVGTSSGLVEFLGLTPNLRFFEGQYIRDVVPTLKGRVWVYTYQGVYLLDPMTSQVLKSYNGENSPILALTDYDHVLDALVVREKEGEVWIGSELGLSILKTEIVSLPEEIEGPYVVPNPATGVDKKVVICNLPSNFEVSFYTLSGERIPIHLVNLVKGENYAFFDPTSLSAGLYLILIKTGGSVHRLKFSLIK